MYNRNCNLKKNNILTNCKYYTKGTESITIIICRTATINYKRCLFFKLKMMEDSVFVLGFVIFSVCLLVG